MTNVRQETISGAKWGVIAKYTNSAITILNTVILARLLSPSDYGLVEMVGIFFAIADIFIDSGFCTALIRKVNSTQEDASTVFFYNVGMSFFFYIILFLSAPYIASFYNQPILKDIVRIVGISLILGAFGAVQKAITKKRREFKKASVISISATIITTPIVLFLAYKGFGVWSLVYFQLSRNIFISIMFWIWTNWRPIWVFSKKSFLEFFSFGNKIIVTNLLSDAYEKISSLMIGKFYTPTDLGFYSKGKEVSVRGVSFVSVIMDITYPIFSNIQDDEEKLFRVYSKFIKAISIIIFFVMGLLVVMAKQVILILYGTAWTESIIFLQLFCLATMFSHIEKINTSLMLVKGRSDLFMRTEIIKKTVLLSLLVISLPFGIIPFAICGVIGSYIAVFVNTFYTGKYYGLTFRKQFSYFIPYLLIAAVSLSPAVILTFLDLNKFLTLILGGVLSFAVYVFWLWKKKDEPFLDLLKAIPEKYRKRLRIPTSA